MRPLAPAPNLATEVARRIADEIGSGRLLPGARLPTEAEMMVAMGVSRTVIREAVAALKADGLVLTRQGSGAFVAADGAGRPFRLEHGGSDTLADVVGVLELRMAVEVESAAMAAERASARQIGDVQRAFEAIEREIARGGSAVQEDFAFHCAIAAGTGNGHFGRFLRYLGQVVIPRQRISASNADPLERTRYLSRLQDEHRRIMDAITARAPGEARAAMRTHLRNSLARYRGLTAGPPEGHAAPRAARAAAGIKP